MWKVRDAALRLEGPSQEKRHLRRADLHAVHDQASAGKGPLPDARGRVREVEIGAPAVSRLSVLCTMSSIVARATASGVHIQIIDDPDFIYRLLIERRGGVKGSGREVMLDLCEFADRNRKRIALLCENSALERYYTQFGFQRHSLQTILGIGMERFPQ